MYKYDKNNVFFKIINNDIPSEKYYEDEVLVIIADINPIARLHFLAICKGEYVNYNHFLNNADSSEVVHFFKAVNSFINKHNLSNNCKLICNNGLGQTVMHYHIHIVSDIFEGKDCIKTN